MNENITPNDSGNQIWVQFNFHVGSNNNGNRINWRITRTGNTLLQYTDRPIRMRNKPRPGNEWWGTDIKDELKGAHALVTNMSLSAIDAIKMGIPTFTDTDNIASPVSNTVISSIENPLKPNYHRFRIE